MQVDVEKTSDVSRKLSVTIPAQQVEEVFDRVYRRISKGAKVPGFRPGKVPRGVLEAHYGSQVKDEVESELIQDSLHKAIVDNEVSPVARPKVAPGNLAKGSDFTYTAEVEIQPDIKLTKYKGIDVPKVDSKLDTSKVDAQLERLREQQVQLAPVLDRDVVQEGDVVVLDYEGTMGGIPFDGGKAENAMVEVGGSGYIPGFTEGLVGAKVPGTRDVQVDFPKDYGAEHLAGKPATFKMNLKELKKKDLPDLDDDFAQDLGEEDLAGLKKKIEEGIAAEHKRETEGEQRKALLENLVKENPFELAPSMIEDQTDRLIMQAANQVQMMMGNQKLQLSDDDVANLREENRANAEFQVRSGLLLLEIAKEEKLEVSDDEIEKEIESQAEQAGDNGPRLKAMYGNPQERDRLKYRMLEDKTVSLLLENATEVDAPSKADKKEG